MPLLKQHFSDVHITLLLAKKFNQIKIILESIISILSD